ncbi:MAG: glycosyltransferase family 4 protein, partial [Akkermansiaceae bacterium]
ISAFACEPDEGSEPEVGWSWAHEMAKEVDVVVLTQGKNRERIECWYLEHPEVTVRPYFEYLDLGAQWLKYKKRCGPFLLPYYIRWQWKAAQMEAALMEKHQLDLVHHVTFASFRYPIFWKKLPIVWGPVGGADNAPFSLIYHGGGFIEGTRELVRNLSTWISSKWLATFGTLDQRVTRAFACTPQTYEVLQDAGIDSEVMPTISAVAPGAPFSCWNDGNGPIRFLYVGRLHHLKGVHLLIDALIKIADQPFELDIIGGGASRLTLEDKVRGAKLDKKVRFLGQIPRVSLKSHYRRADVLIAPSLYESGGMTVLEAFQQARPAIVLDCGGHAISVAEGCGTRVNAHQSAEAVICDLSLAIQSYLNDSDKIEQEGLRAWAHLRDSYSWETKRARMLDAYEACQNTK